MSILSDLQGPADLRGLSEPQLTQLAAEIRDTIIRTVAETGGHLGSSLGVVELDDRPPSAAGVAARPDRLGHGPPGLPAQAPDRPTGPLCDAALARRRRWLPAPERIAPRRLRWRSRRNRALDRRGAGGGARPAPRDGTDRGRRRRRGADERPVARGAQRHRPAPDPDAHRGQRQRDVDQPDRRRVLEVPLADQAVERLAPEQERLRPDRRARAGPRTPHPRAVEAVAGLRGAVRPAGPAVRGPRAHVHRRRAGARPPGVDRDARGRARAARADDRPRAHAEGPRVPTGDRGPGQLPRRRPAADRAHARYRRLRRLEDEGEGRRQGREGGRGHARAPRRRCRPRRWPTTPRHRPASRRHRRSTPTTPRCSRRS